MARIGADCTVGFVLILPARTHAAQIVPLKPGPASDSVARATGFGIPADLLARARKRLAVLALGMCALSAATASLTVVDSIVSGEPISVGTIDIGLIVLNAAVYAAVRGQRLGHSAVFAIGLCLEILMCFAIFWGNIGGVYGRHGHVPAFTFANIIIVVFPLVVPAPPRWTFVAAMASAAMAPLALFLLGLRHGVAFAGVDYFHTCLAPGISVAIAVFGSRVIHGISLEVAKARRMGSYELVDLIGHGGMGEVWRAEHRYLARPAALKLIRPEALSASDTADVARKRFEREAQATAALRSHHTINLFDFGITDDGTFFYVMELLDGVDLDTLVKTHGPLPAERAICLLLQACDSLGEAHECGMIHRDIKPANLIVCKYGRRHDFVKVLDFGLVRAPAEPTGSDSNLTREGSVAGTPAYMAPELATGEAKVDHRLDLYALGCVAYWMLTGQLVFEATGALGMVVKHATDAPARPSERTEIDVPADLEKTVMDCLAKDPADRPQTADELAERLRACEVPAWTEARARKWWESHRP
jgi:serine/threonine-protein kinase